MCLDCVKSVALAAMVGKAKKLGVSGVAVVQVILPPEEGEDEGSLVVWDPLAVVVGRFYREADPDKGEGDTGANYYNVAFSKLGEQLETTLPSGTAGRPPRKGEFGYRGGEVYVLEDGTELHATFSGGTEDQDVQIATAGMEKLRIGMATLEAMEDLAEEIGSAVEEFRDSLKGLSV